MTDSKIQVGEGGRKFRWPKWQSVVVFVSVIVVAGAAGVGLRWLQQYRDYKQQAKPDAVAAKAVNAQDIALSGDYDKAHKEISEALDNPQLSNDGKYTLLFQQGVTYENQQNYDAAIQSYKAAEAIKVTQSVAEAIARTAETKGDKELAISYYKKAITLIDTNQPLAEDTRKFYEQSIVNLGGQP